MRQLPLGTIRNLQASSTPNGQFAIIAVDHRDALRALMNPLEPGSVSARELEDFKISIASILVPEASAVVLDAMYSAPQVIAMEKFPFNRAMLVALEEQGYLGDPFSRRTTLIEGWGVEKAKRMGASMIKLLVYYHPDSTTLAGDDRSGADLRCLGWLCGGARPPIAPRKGLLVFESRERRSGAHRQ